MVLAPCTRDDVLAHHAHELHAIFAMTRPSDQASDLTFVPWGELPPARRLELQEAYGHYLDTLPPTCSMEEKNRRFARWLAARGVAFP